MMAKNSEIYIVILELMEVDRQQTNVSDSIPQVLVLGDDVNVHNYKYSVRFAHLVSERQWSSCPYFVEQVAACHGKEVSRMLYVKGVDFWKSCSKLIFLHICYPIKGMLVGGGSMSVV